MPDLFDDTQNNLKKIGTKKPHKRKGYSAKDIEVLEGLEPVRLRPGMYIGGTDERAVHHLAAEIMDNSMDEAVAGEASRIDLELTAENCVTVSDNGRGIPVDPHPKFKDKSAVEVILTTLHSGGKFNGEVYEIAGGLHGVGLSVVNALSDNLIVEIARDKKIWTQSYERGKPTTKLKNTGKTSNRRGTTVTFHPDPKIFGNKVHFRPSTLYKMARSKAYLFKGVEIRWKCDPALLKNDSETPEKATLHFPGGLTDYLQGTLDERVTVTPLPFSGHANLNGSTGTVEWAVAWPVDEDEFFNSYCNTIPTPLGGTHEAGLRSALNRGLKGYGELTKNKAATKINADDVVGGACIMLSVFIHDPQFQGQTKEKLATVEVQKLVEGSIGDHFDHWLSGDPETAKRLLDHVVERSNIRLRKRQDKVLKRQWATKRLRVPGNLSDCSLNSAEGTEIFIVEGDSAGGSAKQGRNRQTQAILPLKGKILNVASASEDKIKLNQEINDLKEALGCGTGAHYRDEDLRYEKVIIMTDADVDGAHIASLLMTFFFKEMPQLIENGHLFIALPPLYRLSQGGKTLYAMDDAHKEFLIENELAGKAKIEVSRFKGLGEMPPAQLKETAMAEETRTLLRVTVPLRHTDDEKVEAKETARLVDDLMGKKPELRLAYIRSHASEIEDNMLDV